MIKFIPSSKTQRPPSMKMNKQKNLWAIWKRTSNFSRRNALRNQSKCLCIEIFSLQRSRINFLKVNSQCTSPDTLSLAWNMDWWSISHMIIYMFQCYSLKSSHWVQKSVRYICVSYCLSLGWLWGMGWGERWEGGSGWGTHAHPWLIHVNVWQKPPQYCKVINLQFK